MKTDFAQTSSIEKHLLINIYSLYFVTLTILIYHCTCCKIYFCKFSQKPLFLDKEAFKENLLTLKVAFPPYCTIKLEDFT